MKSDQIKVGVERAPHRSLLKAMGYTDEEIADLFDGFIHINVIKKRRKKLGKGFFVVKKQ